MKRILLPILVIGILLLSACAAPTTVPPAEAPPAEAPPPEQPTAPPVEVPAYNPPSHKPPAPTYEPTSDTESALVYKVLDFDKILILRKNDEAYILEKGIGCLSLDFYEGRHILIYSPGLFAGIGSKIILPDRDQLCRIWNAEFIGIKPIIIESNINGAFEGWDGDTIFELRNGQIWQQVSYSYTYHYAYNPEVFIYSTIGGYKMMVDGVSATIYVRRLK